MMIRRALAVLALIIVAAAASGQSGLYLFTIDQDALAGAPDFSALNKPLTAGDALIVRDGHFYREIGGDPVRLFGVNFTLSANLPTSSDAARIARRLRKLGINLVRLHALEAEPFNSPTGIRLITAGPYPSLNAESVALLRTFLDALSVEGIYVDLNLHVGYEFRPAIDGVPSITPGATFPRQSKPLHIFQPRMIELQAQYARDVIAALRLGDDPVLAMIEINNESSLVNSWKRDNLDDALFPEYEAELRRQWNVWLAGRYPTTEQIAAAWASAATTEGPELLTNGNFSAGAAPWQLTASAPAQASLSVVTDAAAPAARVDVTRTGGSILLRQSTFSIDRGVHYEAACDARAELPAGQSRVVRFAVGRDAPYLEMAGRPWQLTNQWQRYRAGFESTLATTVSGRFSFTMEQATGVVLVRNCSLRRAARRGLPSGEVLPSISLLREVDFNVATLTRTNDYLSFLADTDRAYFAAIKAAVREAVSRRAVPITGTQVEFGGLLNLDSLADMDYLDNHFYNDGINYPNSAGGPDNFDWRLRNTSGVGSGLPGLQSMAISREAGRPYTVSEYNQPWPNTQGTEILPVVAAFAAFQDWDAIMYYGYETQRTLWDSNFGRSYNLNGEPNKLAQVGQAAWLFRTGAVRPGRALLALPLRLSARLQSGRDKQRTDPIPAFVQANYGFNPNLAFVRRIGVYRSESDGAPALPSPSPPFVSDTNELTYDPTGRMYKIHSERAAGLIGYLGTSLWTAGPLGVQLSSGARGFAAVLLTPLDGQTLATSRRLLLTAPGYGLRSLPNGQPQMLTPYPGTTDWFTLAPLPGSTGPSDNHGQGVGPNWMEPVGATITLDLSGSEFTVFPLDRTGARLASIAVQARRFQLQSSPWYEVVIGSATASRR